MNTAFNYNFWDLWKLYHKVTFDGANRIIRVNEGVTDLDIKTEVYSDWKEWTASMPDNAVWLPAIRTVGGDPTTSGQAAGDIYFLINGWKLEIDLTKVKVTGVLFSDDYDSAYYDYNGVIQFPIEVSSIVNSSSATSSSGGVSTEVQTLVETIDTTTKDTNTKISSLQTSNSEILGKVLEVWQLMGLDLTNPKTITDTSITVNGITLTIGQPDQDTTTVTRS